MPCPCTNNTVIQNNCGCSQPTCQETSCACPVFIKSDCVTEVTADLSCLNLESGLPLNQTLENIACAVQDEIDGVVSNFQLVNIGNGSEVYKGINLLGQKQIRKINKVGDLITITQNTDDISVGINEQALDTFIEENQLTTIANKLDPNIGKNVYKDTTVVEDVSTLNFRSLNSNTLTLTETDTEVLINLPSTSTIPALYVNNIYEPSYDEFLAGNTKGLGTLSKPFTDTITSWTLGGLAVKTPNTAIQNALDAYVDAPNGGTRKNPEKAGQRIIVQDNNGAHVFTGDLNYSFLNILIQSNFLSTTSGFLVDMDNDTAFDEEGSNVTIEISEDKILEIQGDGFNNTGNTKVGATYQTGRICYIKGNGLIYSATNNIVKYIINSDPLSTSNAGAGSNNDGNLTFDIRCNLRADLQGIYKIGGKSKIDFYGRVESGIITNTVNPLLKAFHQTGGQVRFFQGSQILFNGNTRNSAITFTPISPFIPTFIGINNIFGGTTINLFEKTTNSGVIIEVTNSISGYGLNIYNVFESPNLWTVLFRENTLATGIIDPTKADLTDSNNTSSINTVGGNLIETLVQYGNRAAAEAVLPVHSKFINTNSGNVNKGTWFIDITMQ